MTYARILKLAIIAQLDIWQHAKHEFEKSGDLAAKKKADWAWKDAKTLAALLRTEREDVPAEYQSVFH